MVRLGSEKSVDPFALPPVLRVLVANDWPSGSRFCIVAAAGIRNFYLQDLNSQGDSSSISSSWQFHAFPSLTPDQ